MTGFHLPENKVKQSLVQGKKKAHKKPKIMYLLQEGEMETYMDDFMDAEDKPKTEE